ncbi:hypothetical protein A3Q56_02809 [Intoshia linei]|uniref:RdRp catalytic domain-containing protein n=1 Tax=Intoshia linei TaxID=1819745 RepID=A0A177B5A7_9BILA|nr:hypothetical protein A3Q56_02809 [Intoshia linei]
MVRLIFLDASLGGLCGVALTRFAISPFPDPITESLTFWTISIEAGNPQIKIFEFSDFNLLETPSALNTIGYSSPVTLIKNQVKLNLQQNSHKIKNKEIKECIEMTRGHESDYIQYFSSITPLFPRFLSTFYQATIFGHINNFEYEENVPKSDNGDIDMKNLKDIFDICNLFIFSVWTNKRDQFTKNFHYLKNIISDKKMSQHFDGRR